MSTAIPPDVIKTIARLRAEGREKLRLADDLERNYTGDDPKQASLLPVGRDGFFAATSLISEPNVENLTQYLRKRGARLADLAKAFNVTEDKMKAVIAGSHGKLFIPDWRGWVKIKTK